MRRFSDSSQLPNLECFISQTYVLMEQHVVCNEDINYVLRMFCCSEYAEHVMDSNWIIQCYIDGFEILIRIKEGKIFNNGLWIFFIDDVNATFSVILTVRVWPKEKHLTKVSSMVCSINGYYENNSISLACLMLKIRRI